MYYQDCLAHHAEAMCPSVEVEVSVCLVVIILFSKYPQDDTIKSFFEVFNLKEYLCASLPLLIPKHGCQKGVNHLKQDSSRVCVCGPDSLKVQRNLCRNISISCCLTLKAIIFEALCARKALSSSVNILQHSPIQLRVLLMAYGGMSSTILLLTSSPVILVCSSIGRMVIK